MNSQTPGAQHARSTLAPSEKRTLALLVATAFFVRLFLLRYQYVINTDGVYYAVLGKKLVSGDFQGGLSTYWPPLYPLLVGLSSLVFDDLEFAARFVSVIAGTLLIVPLYLLIRRSYDRATATVGASLAVIYPGLTDSSTLAMAEALYALLLATSLLTALSALCDHSPRSSLFTGLLLGAAYLTKPEAICYSALLVVFLLGVGLVSKPRRIAASAYDALLILFGVWLVSAPYIVFVHQRTGRWTISQKIVANLSIVHSARGLLDLPPNGGLTMMDELYGETYFTGSSQGAGAWAGRESGPSPTSPAVVVQPGRESPGTPIGHRANFPNLFRRSAQALRQALKEILPEIFPYPFMALAILALFRQPWTKRRTIQESYLLSFVAATFVGYSVSVIEGRYLVAILPILISWASRGVIELQDWAIETAGHWGVALTDRVGAIRMAIVAVLVVWLLRSILFPATIDRWHDLPYEQKEAGMWLRQHGVPSPLIIASGPWAAFYAEGRHQFIPTAGRAESLEHAERSGADYLIVDERFQGNAPLGSLLDPTQAPENLSPVYENHDAPGYRVVVYELRHHHSHAG
jgi:4-amino-4-deoxy-L-arabinose transferase-like glycosyltransferase